MANNYWEELGMPEEILDYHTMELEKMHVPEWARIDCPHCSKKVSLNGIRNISLCLNTRNLGDLSIEFHCGSCKTLDTVYFRQEVKVTVSEMSGFFDGSVQPATTEYVVESDMYKQNYNNLIEKMLGEQQNVDD